MTPSKRTLTYREAIHLHLLLAIKADMPKELDDLDRRIYYGVLSWEPYGGLPDPETTPLVFLDPRWEGDVALINEAAARGIGKEET